MRRNLSSKVFCQLAEIQLLWLQIKIFNRLCLDIWIFTDEGLVIYPIWTKYTFFFPTLYGSASILRPKQSINFLHSVIFNVKMGSECSLFSSTSLVVRKTDSVVILSSRKISEMLHLLSPSILYHHNLPLLILWKNSARALQTSWHPGYGEIFHLRPLSNTKQIRHPSRPGLKGAANEKISPYPGCHEV